MLFYSEISNDVSFINFVISDVEQKYKSLSSIFPSFSPLKVSLSKGFSVLYLLCNLKYASIYNPNLFAYEKDIFMVGIMGLPLSLALCHICLSWLEQVILPVPFWMLSDSLMRGDILQISYAGDEELLSRFTVDPDF